MKKYLPDSRCAIGPALVILIAVSFVAGRAPAVPFHQPTVDGVIQGNVTDWDPLDLVVDDIADDDIATRQANVRRLWCTWDADNLYLAVTYQDFGPDDALRIYVDLGRGIGPESAGGLAEYAGNYRMPAGGAFELVLGRSADSGFSVAPDAPAPRPVLVTGTDGSVVEISGFQAKQGYNTGSKSAARFPFWFNAEFALPWSELYPDASGTVPAHAVVRAVAIASRAEAGLNGIDSAPDNAGLDGGSGEVLLRNLHLSVIDSDGDGEPDPANGTVSGSAILPGDDGTAALTVSAERVDLSGGPVSHATFAAGERDWTLGRLSTGSYLLTLEAEGYFPTEVSVDVVAGETTAIEPVTLPRATAIRGSIGYQSGPGAAGTAILRGATGFEIDRWDFSQGGPYVFYVLNSGNYSIDVEADTYLAASRSLAVTAGIDVSGFDFLLERQTAISGTVSFESGPGQQGTVRFLAEDGSELGLRDFIAAGGPFEFFTAESGTFTLSASANTYLQIEETVEVTLGQDRSGIELVLPRAPLISGRIGFEGPFSEGLAKLYDAATGALRDTFVVQEAGQAFDYYLEPGEFRLVIEAPGYVPRTELFSVALADMDLGTLDLSIVRATHLIIVDEEDLEIPEVRGTVSQPGEDRWFFARVDLLAVDDAGRIDLFDVDNNLNGFRLSSRKMDDVSGPTGTPAFYASAALADTSTVVNFSQGHASFRMTDDSVEVLRVYLAQPAKDPIAGRIVVAFLDPQPTVVVLSAERDTLVADGVEAVTIEAQLYDASENESKIADVPVTFVVTDASSGAGAFEVATTTTNADGRAFADLTARGAGALDLSASTTYANRLLEVRGSSLGSGEESLRIVALAGPVDGWDLDLPGTLSPFNQPVDVTAQLIDAYGNSVREAGHEVDFLVDPLGFGSFDPASAMTDTNGRAASNFIPTEQAGLVSFRAEGSGLRPAAADLQLGDLFLVSDPAWYDEPADHQTFAETDLTAVVVDNTADELRLDIPFSPGIGGMQMHVLFETEWNADGGSADAWSQPVRYGHDDLPDYTLTAKLFDNGWAELRGWQNGTLDNWWNPEAAEGGDFGGTAASVGAWVTRNGGNISIRIPWTPFDKLGGRPDSMRIEVYVTQDDNGTKRSAFDSVPSDATTNLDFDLYAPGDGDWDIAEETVTLSAWSSPYTVKTDFPAPPEVDEVTVAPTEVTAGDMITLSARISDAGDGIGDVLADLSGMGGGALTRMYDDGDSQHGDLTADDGIFSLSTLVPVDNAGGTQALAVRAYDAANLSSAAGETELDVAAIVEPILYVEDAIGDDHGPNQPGVRGKYYTYPTNLVFVEGAFDIESLTVFETRQIVGGESIEMIAFQVKIGDFPDPADAGTADWNPDHADLNIQKLDIVIDSAPGGATESLPNRLAAFQSWDAWDYAIIMDGWFKALVPSLGQNTTDSWRSNALTTDSDIILRSDPELDTVTALVSKEALGAPTAEQIRSWDIAVCMGSHDFGGEEVLGGIRWVHANRSEWQFGGGYRDDGDNIDSNLLDLLLIPGTGKEPGRSQEEIMDYDSDEARERKEAGKTSVAIEMSAFVDTGPPVIDTGGDGSIVTQVYPLSESPLALALNISDDFRVDEATFRYRSTGFSGDGWDREVKMGDLGNDLWVVDIMPSWLDSNLIYSPVDSTRYLEFEVQAIDGSDEAKESTSPVTTLQIWPDSDCRQRSGTLTESLSLLQQEGSRISVSEFLRRQLVANHMSQVWTGPEASPDTMGGEIELVWDLCQTNRAAQRAAAIPPADAIGVFRDVFLSTRDSLGGWLDYTDRTPRPFEVSLHYPQVQIPGGVDENKLALYRYNAPANRWSLVGGHVAAHGNTVTAQVDRPGSYGVFYADGLNYDRGEVISGITVSPNPFSPNGDGLYDETTVSFFLTEAASVTVEIYNIDGIRKKVLEDTFEYAGDELEGGAPLRVPGLIWDGTDLAGQPVPYGIYIMRVIAKYGIPGNERYVRSNHSLAVIK